MSSQILNGERTPRALNTIVAALDPASLDRLSRIPCLLIDGHFRDADRWDHLQTISETPSAGPDAPPDGWVGLARSALHMAWYWTHAHPDAVELVLGATEHCAARIAKLEFAELDGIAARHASWFGLRWQARPDIWRSLASRAQDPTQAGV
ncbi:MAG TPA: hypothetical protein VGN07_16015 [Steroidobacteraceae bacterium]|jgi:hypothetical protein